MSFAKRIDSCQTIKSRWDWTDTHSARAGSAPLTIAPNFDADGAWTAITAAWMRPLQRKMCGEPSLFGYPLCAERAFMTARLATLFVLIAAPALGQFSQASEKCFATAMTQLEINDCAGAELKRAETELQDRYRKLVAIAAGDKTHLGKIKVMQTAWTAYRDAYIESRWPAPEEQYGSIYSASVYIALARLTRQQMAAVDAILEEYKPR